MEWCGEGKRAGDLFGTACSQLERSRAPGSAWRPSCRSLGPLVVPCSLATGACRYVASPLQAWFTYVYLLGCRCLPQPLSLSQSASPSQEHLMPAPGSAPDPRLYPGGLGFSGSRLGLQSCRDGSGLDAPWDVCDLGYDPGERRGTWRRAELTHFDTFRVRLEHEIRAASASAWAGQTPPPASSSLVSCHFCLNTGMMR